MPSYFIAQIDIHDQAGYARYLEGTAPLLERFSGRVLAVETRPAILEGEWPFERTVLIEFPTMEDLNRWYDSPGYRRLAEHRKGAATANCVAVQGRD